MDSPAPSSARKRSNSGFTLVELLMVLAPVLFIGAGVASAYLFLGRNFTRLGNTQQQDVKGRRILLQFTQDVGAAVFFKSGISSTGFTLYIPMPLTNCSTTSGSAIVTCSSTAGMLVDSASPSGSYVWGTYGALSYTGCSTTIGSAIVNCASTAGLPVGAALTSTSASVPSNATVLSITNATRFVMSVNATATTSGITINTGPSSYKNCVPDNTTLASITNGTTFVMSATATGTANNLTLYTTRKITYFYDSASTSPSPKVTRTDVKTGVTTTLLTDIDQNYQSTSPLNGFVYYTQSGAIATSSNSVKAVELIFTTKLGSAKNGTLASYTIVSPRVVVRSSQFLP